MIIWAAATSAARRRAIVWGGEDGATAHFTGGRYDPASDLWTPTSTGPFTPFGRRLHTVVWTGTEMIVWGGLRGTGETDTGARYCAAPSATIFADGFESGDTSAWSNSMP